MKKPEKLEFQLICFIFSRNLYIVEEMMFKKNEIFSEKIKNVEKLNKSCYILTVKIP